MPRIRTIKPEFWTSEIVAGWHPETRLTFIGLWTLADDNGVGLANERLIASQLYPLDDPQEASVRVHRALTEASNKGQIVLYEAAGKRLYYCTGWDEHQRINRPSTSRFPRPDNVSPRPPTSGNDGHASSTTGAVTEPGVSPHRDLSEGSPPEGKGREGSSSSDTAPPRSDKPKPPEPHRDDVEAVCTRLRDLIVANGSKEPTITQEWRRQARLMIDNDKRDLSKALNLIEWCQKDSFWQGNVLSMPKFRQQYDQLALKAREEWRKRGEQSVTCDPDKNPWAGMKFV